MNAGYALRRPAVRRALSRAAANLVAVAAVSVIFGMKAYIDGQTRAHAPIAAAPAHPSSSAR